MPAAEKDAVVSGDSGVPKVTVPGPLTFDQDDVTDEPVGSPSSDIVPSRFAVAGNVTELSGPALTDGAVFAGAVPPVPSPVRIR